MRSWSVEAWLNGNVWESEDGPRVRWLAGKSKRTDRRFDLLDAILRDATRTAG